MKNIKSKTTATTIALFLMLTIAASLVAVLPTAKAQPIQYYASFVYVSAAPDPVGLGQPVIFVMWTSEMPPATPTDYLLGSVGGRAAWAGITATITKPDKTNQTIAFPVTDPVGGTWYKFVPDKVGTYSVQVHFPATWKNTTTYKRLYAAADSPIDTFEVTAELLEWLPMTPLPAEYWTRPIYAYNRDWYQIAGNWITGLRDLPYITGPDTAHIVWTEPYFFGGIAGGASEHISFHIGSAYQAKFNLPTIISGILIYDLNLGDSNTASHKTVVARDLRTGELLWEVNGTAISRSTIYEYNSPNQHGVHPYLWVSNNIALDPFTGRELFRFINVPSGTEAVGPNGEWQIYVIGGPTANRTWLALWDFSAVLTMTGLSASGIAQFRIDHIETTSYWQWRPVGKVHNGSEAEAYRWNVTLPPGLPGSIQWVLDDRVIGGTINSAGAPNEPFTIWAVSTKEGRQGQLLWKTEQKTAVSNVLMQYAVASLEEGVFVLRTKETMQNVGFDIDNGKQLWITEPEDVWMMYSREVSISDGKLYMSGYGGELYAYNITTGDRLWTFSSDTCGLEGPYENWPFRGTMVVVDGKVYLTTDEHSPTQPLYRGWTLYCVDAETGKGIWNITGHYCYGNIAISDGYLVGLDVMANQITAFGKGPTATTVMASPKISVHGNSVLVEGSVTDISPGTEQYALRARFPNGVPAVADEHMRPWMEYVYMQMPKPTDVEGVEVSLDTIDPNGNFVHIGTVTSDINGNYGYAFTPEVPGTYQIIATFAESESYWGSSATTYLSVGEASPVTPPPPAAQPLPPIETYFIAATVVLLIAIAIVGILLLRKRS